MGVTEMVAMLQGLLLGVLAATVAASPDPQHFGIKSGIVGGQEAEPHQFPWQISLKYLDIWPHHYHTCGATIVDSSVAQMPDKLQYVEMPIVSRPDCQEDYSGVNGVDEGMICAGIDEGGISACSGDSGGPFACPNENGTLQLSGIVSWGMIPCGQANRPSVYTNVGYFRDWIDEHLAL